jgi:hypothetical protein
MSWGDSGRWSWGMPLVCGVHKGGGLTAERRRFREELRLEAAGRFKRGERNAVIARDLRASVRSVQGWWRAWADDDKTIAAA